MFSADILDNEGNKIRTLSGGTFEVTNITREINGNDRGEIRIPTFLGIGESRVENTVLSDLSVEKNGIRKINIYYEETPYNRQLLFSGFIFAVVNTTIQVIYQLEGIQFYIQRKSMNQAFNYVNPGETVFSILRSEWDKINTRYPTGINIVSTDSTPSTANIIAGEKFGQLASRMIDLGFEIKYDYPNITIEPVIGKQITQSLSYHYASTAVSTVTPPDRKDEDGGLLGNSCFGKTDTGDAFFSDVPATQEEITIFKNFSDGDALTKAEEYVRDYQNGEVEYDIILNKQNWDLAEVEIGDFINVNIRRGFSVMDIVEKSRVVRKQITSSGGEIIQTVSVASVKKQEGLEEDILKRIKALEDLT